MMSQNEVRACQPILHCAQEERWVVTNLGSVSFDLCASQAAVQDVEAEIRFQVRLSTKMVCSDQPEGCVLSCLHSAVSQGIPAIRVRGSGMSVQASAFRAPQPVRFSGQLGKEQTRANAEDLFF